jgi:hypothetical protein
LLGATTQDFGPFDIPSGGFLRSIICEFVGENGSGATGALAGDAPWSAVRSIELADVNGQAIVYANIKGYDWYLINRFGAYQFCGIPDMAPNANLTSVAAPQFYLRIPVEIDATDGYGSLPNLNAAEPYRVRLTLGTVADAYSVAPTTAPDFKIRAWSEDWSLPAEKDGAGNAQATTPPDMNTTQYWSKTVVPLVSGANTVRLTRMGNLLRNVILIYRTSAGVRYGTLPTDMTVTWDRYQLYKEDSIIRRLIVSEQMGQYGYTIPTGVVPYQWTEDGGAPAAEKRNLWIPTMQPTEFRMDFTADAGLAAGTLEILTNDVAAAGGR